MKALVTGATGFVGGAVARALVKTGIEAVSYTHLTLPTSDLG